MTAPRRVVIGVGNPDRGDDGVGRAVARRLRGRVPPGVEVVEETGEASALAAILEDAASAWLIDAAAPAGRPGAVRRLDAAAGPLPRGTAAASTHGLGVAEAVELARALGALPPRCLVYAIEGARFDHGAPLSPKVAASVAHVADRVLRDLCPERAKSAR